MDEKVQTIKEVLPELSNDIIEVLLIENENDLEKSLNAALTYQRIGELEGEEKETTPHQADRGIVLNVDNSFNNSPHNFRNYTLNDRSNNGVDTNLQVSRSYRGSTIELPENFLSVPNCRVASWKTYHDWIEYSVIFKRKSAKIGLNIDIVDGMITVLQIPRFSTTKTQQQSKCLAEVAGVREGDLILGVNYYYFAPFADKDDIVTILDCSKPLTKIHFLRIPEQQSINPLNSHPYISFVQEAKIISAHHAFLVTITLHALKQKVIFWKKLDIPQLYYSYMDYSIKKTPTMNRKQSKIVDFAIISHFDKTVEIIRPAFVVRILRLESIPREKDLSVILWVMDVQSGYEWIVKKKYTEFQELYQNACFLRSSIQAIEFPIRKISSSQDLMDLQDTLIPQLQVLLAHFIKITSYHTFLPSILKIQLLFMQFLEVAKYEIPIQQKVVKGGDMIRVYVHHVLLLNTLETMINDFTTDYLSHHIHDIDEEWTISKAEATLLELRQFMDQVHQFFLKYFYQDCQEILQTYQESYSDSTIIQEKVLEYETINHYIRKQVEAEIYMKCVDRVKYIVQMTVKNIELIYEDKIMEVAEAPLSRFDIREDFLSKESWWRVIEKFKDFRIPSLPSDKVDTLMNAFLYLTSVYQREHSLKDTSSLGADEMIPCFIYVFAKAVIPELVRLNFELQHLSDPSAALSQRGYCLATLDAAVSHIIHYDPNAILSPHKIPK